MGTDANILIIANPTSGKRRVSRPTEAIAERLRRRGLHVTIRHTKSAGDAERIATEALQQDIAPPTCLVACGGDGTIQQVADALAHAQERLGHQCPSLALAPAGRCNDFARALGISVDPDFIAGVIADGVDRSIDLGRINGRYFCTIVTVGIDAEISRFVDGMTMPLTGTMAYLYGAARVLLRYTPRRLCITGDFGTLDGPVLLACSANTPSYGGAVPIAPSADPMDGRLDLCVIKHTSMWKAFRLIPAVLRGHHTAHPSVTYVQTTRVEIDAPEPLELWADGEPIGRTPAVIEIVPNAVRMRLPRPEGH